MKICHHCGSEILVRRRNVYCSLACEGESHNDQISNLQRIATFQAIADADKWLPIDNTTVYSFSNPNRRVRMLEIWKVDNLTFYRLTKEGKRQLERWKASMEVSA
jgi:hypothetical protein